MCAIDWVTVGELNPARGTSAEEKLPVDASCARASEGSGANEVSGREHRERQATPLISTSHIKTPFTRYSTLCVCVSPFIQGRFYVPLFVNFK